MSNHEIDNIPTSIKQTSNGAFPNLTPLESVMVFAIPAFIVSFMFILFLAAMKTEKDNSADYFYQTKILNVHIVYLPSPAHAAIPERRAIRIELENGRTVVATRTQDEWVDQIHGTRLPRNEYWKLDAMVTHYLSRQLSVDDQSKS